MHKSRHPYRTGCPQVAAMDVTRHLRAGGLRRIHEPTHEARKSVSAVTITSAPGYRTRIQRQRYGGGTYVGSTNLIPLERVDRPEDCNGTFFHPEYLRKD